MKVLVFGAHPDDPESGCRGLASRCVEAGHEKEQRRKICRGWSHK